jgi:FtsH-binding integral membrane protein
MRDQELRFVRALHVTKTVQALFCQFLFTFSCVLFVTFNRAAYMFVFDKILQFIICGGFGGLMTIIYMCAAERKTEAQLAVFTLFETMVVCAGSVLYGEDVVVMAILVTVGVTSALGIYALTSNTDYSSWVGPLSSALMCLLIMSYINLFFGIPILRWCFLDILFLTYNTF